MVQSCGQFYRGALHNLRKYNSFTCQICCVQIEQQQVLAFAECGHNIFCQKCLMIYFKIKLAMFTEINCPLEGCNALIQKDSQFWIGLPEKLQHRYNKYLSSKQKQNDINFRTCPLNSCLGNIVFAGNQFQCTICFQKFCLNCVQKVHKGNCDFEDAKDLLKRMNLRRCPKCKLIIQKNTGCDHIRCLCGFQFCFSCNAPWIGIHLCQRDSSYRVIMKTPHFKEEKKIVQHVQREKPSHIKYESIPTFTYGRIFQTVFIIGFIIPYFGVLSISYAFRMIFPTIFLQAKLTFSIVAIIVLGIGPFTIQLLNKYGPKMKYLLLCLYPLTMIYGVFLSFKELSLPMILYATHSYIRMGKKIGKKVFSDSLE